MERGAAVRTARANEAESAVLVAEQHQVFPKQLAPHRFAFELCGETDRLPVAAHHRAARCAWANAGEIGVFLRSERHLVVSCLLREDAAGCAPTNINSLFEYFVFFAVDFRIRSGPVATGPYFVSYVLSVVKSPFL